ncbi:MAG: enoyl-CoA hydratase/isomerase family protein [Chloroflexi bacterium]|nr:enoyl-CoA hydratase/isomerase family protein [Chloroflexota bacterium]
MTEVLVEALGPLATVTLSRPEAGNAVDGETMAQLTAALKGIKGDDNCRIVVLRGAGADFCVGREAGPPPPSAHEIREGLRKITMVNDLLTQLSAITLAVVQGRALGFGCGLAIRCDITIAAQEARFGFPEIKSGLAPTVVMSYLSRWMPRKKAFELVTTGREMDALEAERLGLVNQVVPQNQLEEAVSNVVSTFLAQDATALRTCKGFWNNIEDMGLAHASEYGINLLANMLASRRR